MIIILHSFFSGIITMIISKIIFELTITNNKYKPYGIEIAFFMTGFILQILNSYFS